MTVSRSISLFFTAGALGGLVYGLLEWGFGELGVTSALGVSLAPDWTPAWLYPHIVWGGIWGAVFVLPVARKGWVRRGLLLGLAPALVELLVILPYDSGQGFLGLDLGNLAPALITFYHLMWGLTASWWVQAVGAS